MSRVISADLRLRSSLFISAGAKLLCYQSILRQVIPKWKRDHERLLQQSERRQTVQRSIRPCSIRFRKEFSDRIEVESGTELLRDSSRGRNIPKGVLTQYIHRNVYQAHTYADTQARIYLDSSKPMHPDTLSARTSQMYNAKMVSIKADTNSNPFFFFFCLFHCGGFSFQVVVVIRKLSRLPE